MEQAEAITRTEETLKNEDGRLVGWIADDGKFHPNGAPLSVEQLRAILAMLTK